VIVGGNVTSLEITGEQHRKSTGTLDNVEPHATE